MPGTVLAELETPCALVDLDRMEANLERVARYCREHGLALRPHIKTHKSPDIGRAQLRLGAHGVTVATTREAEIMAEATDDILVAYPPVGGPRIARLLALPERVRLSVALDSAEAARAMSRAAAERGRTVGVLLEADLGMRRCGVGEPGAAAGLARLVAELPALEYGGLLFYPGHVRRPVGEQRDDLHRLGETLGAHLRALEDAGLPPAVVSGGSTPTLWSSHLLEGVTEIRPGTYVFNDRATAEIGACAWDDCAYSVLARVVSIAVAGQAVIDAGSKALAREELRGAPSGGLGALLDRREVVVRASSEEHGILDLSSTDWRPSVGDLVRVVPNHVCLSVHLQERIRGVRAEEVVRTWPVAARDRERPGSLQPAQPPRQAGQGQTSRSSSQG